MLLFIFKSNNSNQFQFYLLFLFNINLYLLFFFFNKNICFLDNKYYNFNIIAYNCFIHNNCFKKQ